MGCSGACCAVITYGDALHGDIESLRSDPNHDWYTLNMLVPLSNAQAEERAKRFVPLDVVDADLFGPQNEGLFFTCKHWNEETRLCGAYADRPRMCRDYPYGQQCGHGCDYICCRNYPLGPRATRNMAVITYLAARYCEIEKGKVTDLGVA